MFCQYIKNGLNTILKITGRSIRPGFVANTGIHCCQ